jgi:hypothetical protein
MIVAFEIYLNLPEKHKSSYLRDPEDRSILRLQLSLSALLARIERHEVELCELVELLQILDPFRINLFIPLLKPNGKNVCEYQVYSHTGIGFVRYLRKIETRLEDHSVQGVAWRLVPLSCKSSLPPKVRTLIHSADFALVSGITT